jgi:hypothetical protein
MPEYDQCKEQCSFIAAPLREQIAKSVAVKGLTARP